MMTALLLSLPAFADCSAPIPPVEMGQAISVGEAAYLNMEEETFRAAWSDVQQMVPCLSAPIEAPQVIMFYRMGTLHAFIDRDEASGIASFRSLLAREPNYSLSPALASEAHPLQSWRTTAFESPATMTTQLAMPRKGTVWVDGRITEGTVPLDRPYILQHADQDGNMVSSQVVQTGQEPPALGPVRSDRSISPTLLASAGAALVAGGTYALARRSETVFLDPQTPTGDLAGLRRQTNTLSAVSVGAGVTAIGFGATAFLTSTW